MPLVLLAGALGVVVPAIAPPASALGTGSPGTMTLSPTAVAAGSTGNTLTFTYKAVTVTTNVSLEVTVPSGWTPPATTSGTAGYTTSTCGTAGVTGMVIKVTGVTLAAGTTCTIAYGSGGGTTGVTAPSTTGTATFAAARISSTAGTTSPITSPPAAKVVAANGSGTMTVSPVSATASSTANTLTFTYTDAPGGTTHGELVVAVPTGWSAPVTTSGTAGYTTSTCGIVSVFGQNILVGAMTLGGAATCTVTYGSGGGSSAAIAPSTAGTDTFTTAEASVSAEVEPSLATSPKVTVSAPSSGTPTPTTLYVASTGVTGTGDTSCSTAAYSTIQSAVQAAVPGTTIHVCAGTYAEQVKVTTANLTITGPTSGTPATIEPSTVVCNTKDLDTSVPTAAVVLVSGVSGVNIDKLKLTGLAGGKTIFTTCGASSAQNFWGVVYQNASGAVSGNSVLGMTPSSTFSGGNNNDAGIYVQSSKAARSAVTISSNTVSGYQKNGITCNDTGTTCTITANEVTGPGPISTEAQNGIQVGFGATGSVSNNKVSGNDYTGSTTASGILVIQASGVSVTANTLTDDQEAIVLQSFGGYTGTSGAAMTTDTVSSNQISYTSSYSSNSANATSSTEGINVAGFKFGSAAPSVSAVISNNTVDGPGAFGKTSSSMTVKSPVGMEVGYLASSSAAGSLTVSAAGNTFENWAADVMDVGTMTGTDATTLRDNGLLSAAVGVDNVSGPASGTTQVTTDATDNWWGSTSGPGPVGTGSGTHVSAHVTYAPWCSRASCTPPAPPPPLPTTPPPPPSTSKDVSTGSSSASTGSTGTVESKNPSTGVIVTANATGEGAVTVSQLTSAPKPPPSTLTVGSLVDVEVSSGSSFSKLTEKVCGPKVGTAITWYDTATGTWETLKPTSGPTLSTGTPPCVSFSLSSSSAPAISQLTGTAFAVGTTAVAPALRVTGETADATAAAELTRAFPYASGACPASRAAVLATTGAYQDALSAQLLAESLTTGTLLTPTESLSSVTATTLEDEGITTVYVVGGPLALTTTVVKAIEALTAYDCGATTKATGKITVTRIYGQSAYATAEAVAEHVGSAPAKAFPGAYATTNAAGGTGRYNDTAGTGSQAPAGPVPTAILASGEEFQDAQAASVVAYRTKLPLLLTPATTLSSTAVSAIEKLGIKQVILMGGPLAVTGTVEAALVAETGVSVVRVGGNDATDTARELARFEVAGATAGLGWTPGHRIMVARATFFTDGLAGAVLDSPHNTATGASSTARPLLLTESPTVVGTYLATFLKLTGHTGIDASTAKTVTGLTVLGGPLAVSTAVVAAMQTDLGR